MTTTARHALTLLAASQAHKEISHNEALIRVDALLHPAIASATVTVPPVAPAEGTMWLVPSGATGAWAQHSGQIALWQAGGWTFLPPLEGLTVWNMASGTQIMFDGIAWKTEAWPVKALEIGGQTVVSGRRPAIANPLGGAIVDAEARAAIAGALAAMRAHGLIAQ